MKHKWKYPVPYFMPGNVATCSRCGMETRWAKRKSQKPHARADNKVYAQEYRVTGGEWEEHRLTPTCTGGVKP